MYYLSDKSKIVNLSRPMFEDLSKEFLMCKFCGNLWFALHAGHLSCRQVSGYDGLQQLAVPPAASEHLQLEQSIPGPPAPRTGTGLLGLCSGGGLAPAGHWHSPQPCSVERGLAVGATSGPGEPWLWCRLISIGSGSSTA